MIFLIGVSWYLIGLLGSFLILWLEFYERDFLIDESDVSFGVFMAVLGPFNLVVGLISLVPWILSKLRFKLPSIRIRKEK